MGTCDADVQRAGQRLPMTRHRGCRGSLQPRERAQRIEDLRFAAVAAMHDGDAIAHRRQRLWPQRPWMPEIRPMRSGETEGIGGGLTGRSIA